MKRAVWTSSLALLALCFSLCFTGSVAQPRVEIITPKPNVKYLSQNVQVKYRISGFKSPENGYVQMSLNRKAPVLLEAGQDEFSLSHLDEGKYTVTLFLVDHSFKHIKERSSRQDVTFYIEPVAKGIRIETPYYRELVTPNIEVKFSVFNFTIPRDGYIYVSIDGRRGHRYDALAPLQLRNLKDGDHNLLLRLATHDDIPVGDFSQQAFTVGKRPTVAFDHPSDGMTLSEPVHVLYQPENFRLGVDGSVLLSVDGENAILSEKNSFTIGKGLTEGHHNMSLILVDMRRQFVSDEVFVNVNIVHRKVEPTLEIASPLGSQIIQGTDLDVYFDLEHFVPNKDGFIFMTVDGQHTVFGDTDVLKITGLASGEHHLSARLVDLKRLPIDQKEFTVKFRTEAFVGVKIKGMAQTPMVTPDGIVFNLRVDLAIRNFTIPTDGSLWASVNGEAGSLIKNVTDDHISVQNVPPGHYQVRLALANTTNHSVGDSDVGELDVTEKPRVSITSPKNNEVLTLQETLFGEFDLDNFEIPRDGKVFLAVDGVGMSFMDSGRNFTLSNIKEGKHTLTVALTSHSNHRLSENSTVQFFVKKLTGRTRRKAPTLEAQKRMPKIKITKPKNGHALYSPWQFEFKTTNFKVPEDGLVYVHIDGTGVKFLDNDRPFTMSGMEEGKHNMTLTMTKDQQNILGNPVTVNFEVLGRHEVPAMHYKPFLNPLGK